MAQIVKLGEIVYQCSICNRKVRVRNNTTGLSVICYCTITANCKGKLRQVTSIPDILNTPTIPQEVPGLQDWNQRKFLSNHIQKIPKKTWLFTHNLSNLPIFDVLINVGNIQQPYSPIIETIDQNSTNLIFDKPYSGIAQAITLSSQQNIPTTTPVVSDWVQITNDTGLLTIATINTNPLVDLEITYFINNIQQSTLRLFYATDDKASSLSPWTDTNKVYINGHTYTIRSTELIHDPNNYHYFVGGSITPLSSIVLTSINTLPVTYESVVILLSSSPFKTTDKIYDKVIYLDQVTTNQIIYQNGAFFAQPSIIKNIYPYIHVV